MYQQTDLAQLSAHDDAHDADRAVRTILIGTGEPHRRSARAGSNAVEPNRTARGRVRVIAPGTRPRFDAPHGRQIPSIRARSLEWGRIAAGASVLRTFAVVLPRRVTPSDGLAESRLFE